MNTKQELIENIISVLKEKGIDSPKVSLDIPVQTKLGDYSTNVALAYSKELGTKPLDLALDIKERLTALGQKHILRIDVIAPGFINFFFDEHYFGKNVAEILEKGEELGKNKNLDGQKTIIEYTVCNVLKPMHIGHLMGNVIGESLSRVIESAGAEVRRNNYQGDSGLHIAKAVWGILKMGGEKTGSLSEKTDYIGKAYALGATAYDDEPESQKEIKELNKKYLKKATRV